MGRESKTPDTEERYSNVLEFRLLKVRLTLLLIRLRIILRRSLVPTKECLELLAVLSRTCPDNTPFRSLFFPPLVAPLLTFAFAFRSVAAFLFPIFESYKAIKANDQSQLTLWLMYWVIIACVIVVENFLGWFLNWHISLLT